MGLKNISRLTLLSTAAILITGCAFSSGLSPAEQEIKTDLIPSKYQPATREARNNITTQDNFAQAAFWSREYQLNPSDLESAVRLSAAVRKMGNPGKAVEIAQTSRALHPKDPYLTAEFAAALIASERGEDAIEALDGGLRVAPGYARLWSLKGAALDQLEQYEPARQHYARALQITPNDPNIMSNLGLSYALAGDPATSETWLRRAASQPGASANIQQTLDMVIQLQGKPVQQAQAQPRQQAQAQQPYQPRQNAAQNIPQQDTHSSYFQSYEGRGGPQTQPAQNTQSYAARQAAQNYAPQSPPNGTYTANAYGQSRQGQSQAQSQGQTQSYAQPSYAQQPYAKQQGYRAPTQQQTYRPGAQQQPQLSQQKKPAPAATASYSEYSGGYAANAPQALQRSNFTVTGQQPGGLQSAADAARAAAAQSQGQNRRVIVPAEAPMTNDVQTDILSQIARNVGPQPAAEPVQLRRRYTPPPQNYAQGQAQPQNGYPQPQPGYRPYPQPTQGQTAQEPEDNTGSRGAARRR